MAKGSCHVDKKMVAKGGFVDFIFLEFHISQFLDTLLFPFYLQVHKHCCVLWVVAQYTSAGWRSIPKLLPGWTR